MKFFTQLTNVPTAEGRTLAASERTRSDPTDEQGSIDASGLGRLKSIKGSLHGDVLSPTTFVFGESVRTSSVKMPSSYTLLHQQQ